METNGKNGLYGFGKGFFLIRFSYVDDFDKVLKGVLSLLGDTSLPLGHGSLISKLLKLS